MPTPTNVRFFKTPAELRTWFRAHHRSADELWVGFYRKSSGRASITWPEAVDEALCVGWIDGIRKRLDEESYTNRFTPRRPGSVWSAVNIARVAALTKAKRMRRGGVAAFAKRKEYRSGIYAYEQRRDRLEQPYAGMLEQHPRAWEFFQAQPPSYRKVMGWWVVSAKREDTRLARLQKLIEECAAGRRMR